MSGEKYSIRMKRNMSPLVSVALVADMFLPMCVVIFVWRFLPDDLASKLFLLSIAWFLASLLGAAVLRFLSVSRGGLLSSRLSVGD